MFYATPARRRIAAATLGLLLVLAGATAAAEDPAINIQLEKTVSDPQQAQQAVPGTAIVPPLQDKMPPPPEIEGASAILMDAQTGQVIYSKNPHRKLQNASTTKIMTAILLIENCKLTDRIKASKKAAETPYTSIHLQPGEQISAKDVLMAMMVRSANDAAVAAAEHIAGSTAKFAVMMNKKAKEIGCKNTHFVTPNGLYAKGHYSTAYDLCLMARYAFQYPIFNEAINTREYTLSSRTMNKKDLAVYSRHYFMKNYPYADGVKSGYIKQARYCYVGSATRGGWRLLGAVLRSEHSGEDMIKLMEYGFNNFAPFTVARAGEPVARADVNGGAADAVAVGPESDLRVVVPKTGAKVVTSVDLRQLDAPVGEGASVGTITASVNGTKAASAALRALRDIEISSLSRALPWIKTWAIVIICLVVARKYGTAFAKNTRRRRRSIAEALRDFNRYR